MREIKFRGKRVDNGEWVYGFYTMTKFPENIRAIENRGTWHNPIFNLTDEYKYFQKCLAVNEGRYWFPAIQSAENLYSIREVILSTIGQFTGACDKNDKEIYEGDILRNVEGRVFSIDFHAGMFTIRGCGFPFCPRWSEVIGNIHDNSELLEVAK